MYNDLRRVDRKVYDALVAEVRREQVDIELIASENYVSRAVLDVVGSVWTNKYAEGYPGRRYYGGCELADVVETLAIERARELFGAGAGAGAAPATATRPDDASLTAPGGLHHTLRRTSCPQDFRHDLRC